MAMNTSGKFVELFVVAIIAVALLGPLISFIDAAAANVSAVVSTLLYLIPVLYVILIVAGFAFALTAMSKGR